MTRPFDPALGKGEQRDYDKDRRGDPQHLVPAALMGKHRKTASRHQTTLSNISTSSVTWLSSSNVPGRSATNVNVWL